MAKPLSGQSKRRMCPNEGCERYAQPTGLMGGCDCGTQLVAYKVEPTDEQLERLMLALGFGMAAVIRPANWRDAALKIHDLAQRGLNGDVKAQREIASLQAAFGGH